jgi:hypothetical protein
MRLIIHPFLSVLDMRRRRFSWAFVLISASLAPSALFAAQACNISQEKKTEIVAILCGANASERDYKTEGPDCIKQAAVKRFEDTAQVIAFFNACGDSAFGEKLRAANMQTAKFLQLMSTCSAEKFDAASLFEQVQNRINGVAQNLKCDADLQAAIRDRRPYFERLIMQANDPRVRDAIFNKLSIRLDKDGNIVDK